MSPTPPIRFAPLTPLSLLLAVLAMGAVVLGSNVLVQYPINDWLTWGAFSYPVAFLVSNLINRRFGPQAARRVAWAGFAVAVLLSVWLATPRIALASGTAFLVAQLIDVLVFDRLRERAWWQAPLISSVIGAVVDTALFFSIAFAARFAVLDTGLGLEDGSLGFPVPFLGGEAPLWVSLALGDFCIKIAMALLALVPYGALLNVLKPVRA